MYFKAADAKATQIHYTRFLLLYQFKNTDFPQIASLIHKRSGRQTIASQLPLENTLTTSVR
jgi:hypothetical protein